MRTYKLYAASSGNNVANVTIVRSGRIRSLRWAVCMDTVTDNHNVIAEISTQSVSQAGTNDTLGSIDEIRQWHNNAAAGSSTSGINVQRMVDYPVAAGERLYLNTTFTGTVYLTCFIDVAD